MCINTSYGPTITYLISGEIPYGDSPLWNENDCALHHIDSSPFICARIMCYIITVIDDNIVSFGN